MRSSKNFFYSKKVRRHRCNSKKKLCKTVKQLHNAVALQKPARSKGTGLCRCLHYVRASAWVYELMKIIFVVLIIALASISSCNSTAQPNSSGNNSLPNTNNSRAAAPIPVSPPTNASTEPSPKLSLLPPDAKGVQAAIDVIHQYYSAINVRDYRRAYELWSGKGEASGQTFEQFRDGFSNTASVEIDTSGEPGDLEGAAGSQYATIPIRISARTKHGSGQHFAGEYVLRRSMVDGATPEQRSWRIYSAKIHEVPE